MNAAIRLVIAVLIVTLTRGCAAHAPPKLYPGPAHPFESLAVLMTHTPKAYLQSVRGNGVNVGIDPRHGAPMHWAGDAIEIPPGEYTFIVGVRGAGGQVPCRGGAASVPLRRSARIGSRSGGRGATPRVR